MNTTLKLLLKLLLVIGIGACGRSMPKVDVAEQSATAQLNSNSGSLSGDAQANACTATQCNAIEMGIDVLGLGQENTLIGYVNDPVNWVIRGQDLAGSARKVVVFLTNTPPGAIITPAQGSNLESSATIAMQPTSPQSSTLPMDIHLRDVERCEMVKNSDPACYQASPLADFDRTIQVNWQITYQGNTGPGVINNTSPINTPTTPIDPCAGQETSKFGKIIRFITNPLGSIVNAISGSDC